MKIWKLLTSLSDHDVISIESKVFKLSDIIMKLNNSLFSALSSQATFGSELHKIDPTLSTDSRSWLDDLCYEEDEPTLLQALNDPELVSQKQVTIQTIDKKKSRLSRKQRLLQSGIKGELLQVQKNWKPCRVVIKMHLEIYTEEEDEDPNSTVTLDELPLDNLT